jgi:hypothetical protein
MPPRNRQPRRAGDAYYTPPELAAACVAALDIPHPRIVLEPSVGGGAFVREVRTRWADVFVHGIDVNERAAGFADCDGHWVGDFAEHAFAPQSFGLVVGNPPYRCAEAHVRAALDLAPRVAFLLRLGFLASQERAPLWRDHPAAAVHVISKRPSFTENGKTDGQEYALFVWDVSHRGETVIRWLDWAAAKARRAAA